MWFRFLESECGMLDQASPKPPLEEPYYGSSLASLRCASSEMCIQIS